MNSPQTPAFSSSLAVGVTRGRETLTASRVSSQRPRIASQAKRARTSQVRCAVADPNEMLTAVELDEWKKVSEMLRSVNGSLGEADADRLVGRAFGWGTQKFWRGDVKHEAPSLRQAEESCTFLREVIELDDPGLAAVIKKFPEVLRLTLDRMNENIETIQKTYPNIKGAMLTNSVKADPAVLGFDFDCEGDCKSECARCWVQF